jgi:hypothetical protein
MFRHMFGCIFGTYWGKYVTWSSCLSYTGGNIVQTCTVIIRVIIWEVVMDITLKCTVSYVVATETYLCTLISYNISQMIYQHSSASEHLRNTCKTTWLYIFWTMHCDIYIYIYIYILCVCVCVCVIRTNKTHTFYINYLI